MSYNIPAPHSRLRPIPFSIDKSKWTLSNGVYTATYETPYITGTSVEWVEYSSTYRTSIRGDVDWIKANGGGGITFITTEQPVGTLEGVIKTIVNNDGRLTLVTQETALPTLRDVPFTLDVDDWTLNETTGMYEIVWETNYITATSHDWLEFDESIENATDAIKVEKAYDDGEVVGMKFISRRCPADDISGKITTLDNADGKVAVVLQDTVMPISAGGTGAVTLAGAKSNLGITALENNLNTLESFVSLLHGLAGDLITLSDINDNATKEINIGFKPERILIVNMFNNGVGTIWLYDKNVSTTTCLCWASSGVNTRTIGNSDSMLYRVTNTGFILKKYAQTATGLVLYFAK